MTISIKRNIINFNHMTLIDLLAISCHNWLVFLTLNLHWFVSILACSIFTKDIRKTQYVVVKRSNCHFWRLWKGVASQVLKEVCYVWKIRGLVGGTLVVNMEWKHDCFQSIIKLKMVVFQSKGNNNQKVVKIICVCVLIVLHGINNHWKFKGNFEKF